jgi:hypothetical protein
MSARPRVFSGNFCIALGRAGQKYHWNVRMPGKAGGGMIGEDAGNLLIIGGNEDKQGDCVILRRFVAMKAAAKRGSL